MAQDTATERDLEEIREAVRVRFSFISLCGGLTPMINDNQVVWLVMWRSLLTNDF